MRIAIVIPVRNCLGYTQRAIETAVTKHELIKIIVDDNSDQSMKDWLASRSDIISIINPAGSTGLAFNWNLGIGRAFEEGAKYVLVANNDVLFNKKTIDNLVERMERGDVVMATGANLSNISPPESIIDMAMDLESEEEHPDFSCFMISKETIEKIGWFDENFIGAYFEDGDMHARIALANERAIKINQAGYFHYASMTVKENINIQAQVSQNFHHNQTYFIRKWGHFNVGDVEDMRRVYYKTPFNDSNRTIKDW